MPIALMFPFAEAAGITLTGLGIAKATDVIMNYIQANPEKSKQILSTLSPTMGGIGSMLMKEKSEGTSDAEQPTEQKDTRSKKEIVLDAIRRGRQGRGNYSSPDAEGPAVSIRGNVIRGLEEAGEVSKERKTPEEMEEEKKTKKPFDYKKFYRADGGRIGYVKGGVATTQDYATALSKVGAGTQEQKNRQVQDYARSEASTQIAKALQGGQSSLDSYLTNVFGQGTPATTSGKYASYNSPFTGIFSSTRNQMIDDVAQQLVQKQAPSFYVDPKASAAEAYGKMMQQKIEEAYGTPDKYRAEAMTLGMPVAAYYDYLVTRDDKNINQQYEKQNPYFDASTYVPFTEADRTPSPYDIYLQEILQQQIDAGVPEEARIRSGEVSLPSFISPTTTGAAARPFMSYQDALEQARQQFSSLTPMLADGGLATLFSMKR